MILVFSVMYFMVENGKKLELALVWCIKSDFTKE